MTIAEFAEFEKVVEDSAEDNGLCRSCLVIAVEPGDVYCPDCTSVICEYLART